MALYGAGSAGSDQRIRDSIRFFPAGNAAGAVRNRVACGWAWNRHFAAGTGAVASAAAIAVVLIPAGSGIRFGGSFDFMVSCLGGGPYQRSFSAPEATC